MTRLTALAGLAAYVCQTAIEHNGKLLPAGSPIELDTAAAQPLLDVQAIGYAEGAAPAPLLAPATGSDRATDQAVIDGGANAELLADNRQLTAQLEASHATIAELRQVAANVGNLLQAEREGRTNDQIAASEALAEAQRAAEVQLAEVQSLQAATEQLQEQLTAAGAANADLVKQLEAAKSGGTKKTR